MGRAVLGSFGTTRINRRLIRTSFPTKRLAFDTTVFVGYVFFSRLNAVNDKPHPSPLPRHLSFKCVRHTTKAPSDVSNSMLSAEIAPSRSDSRECSQIVLQTPSIAGRHDSSTYPNCTVSDDRLGRRLRREW